MFSNALQNDFTLEENTMNPDQTALKGAVLLHREQFDLGPHCLQYRPPKYISRRESRQQML